MSHSVSVPLNAFVRLLICQQSVLMVSVSLEDADTTGD